MFTRDHPAAAAAARRPAPVPRPLRFAQLLLSSGSTVLGVALVAGLLGDPLARTTGVAALLPSWGLGAALVVLGLLGLVALAAGRPTTARTAAALQIVGYLLAAGTWSLIALLGYLLAAAVPLGLLVLAVLVCRRHPMARWLVLLGLAAVTSWGWLTGVLAPANVLATYGRVVPAVLDRAGEQLLLLWLTAGVLVGVRMLAAASVDLPVRAACEDWLLRHQRALTLVAAAGPLPYVLVRATWATPWPVGAPVDLDPSIRFWGLLLGAAGMVGSVLTVGLVRPWGTVAPRWLPVAAGRSVPVAAAVVPASVVTVALVVGAVPMVVSAFTDFADLPAWERAVFLLMFPFWLWGPALGLATWAYALRRRQDVGAPVRAG